MSKLANLLIGKLPYNHHLRRHSYLSPKNNPDLRLVSRGYYSIYHHPDNEAELQRFHFHPKVLECPADMWHDPLVNHSIFFSQSLKEAIDNAGLYKDFSLLPYVLI